MRLWSRRPAFTAVAVVTLALGIGGSTTMYGFLQAIVRFGQPTVPQPESLARLFATAPGERDGRGAVAFGDYRRWREGARSFEELAAYTQETLPLRTADGEDEAEALFVTPSYLSLLNAPPVVGRAFTEQDVAAGDVRPALLSERAWRVRFGAEASVVGTTLDIDGEGRTIVGVVTESLGLVMPSTDLFLPLAGLADGASVRVIGRRRAGLSWTQVDSEVNALGIGSGGQWRVRLVPILEDARFRSHAGWVGLVGPSVLVLLIGCGNVAGLLLVRAVQREREIAIRVALGASRRRLALQLLVESWTLAGGGGALGVLLALLGLRAVRAVIPVSADLSLDAPTLLFAGITTLLTPLVFGAAPLLHGLRGNVAEPLRGSLHRPLFGVGRYHLRDVFAVVEVGLAVALVVVTFLFSSFFVALRSMQPDFDSERLLYAMVSSRSAGARSPEAAADLARSLRERLSAVPGVSGVALGDLPFGGGAVRVGASASEARLRARQVRVDPDYFETLGLPILMGRAIEGGDGRGPAPVAVVNRSLAERLWPGTSPLGKLVHVSSEGHAEALTVVGVARDAVRLGRLDAIDVHTLEFRYCFYRPRSDGPSSALDAIVRVRGEGAPLLAPIRSAVEQTDPGLRLRRVASVGSLLDPTEGQTPLPLYLMGASGGLALILAVIGVFGVMSQMVDERRVELGVRLALGASPRALVGLVVRDGLVRVGVGGLAGLAVVFVTARTGFPGLVGVSAAAPRFWVAILAAVTAAATLACFVPARNAARVDPVRALRSE